MEPVSSKAFFFWAIFSDSSICLNRSSNCAVMVDYRMSGWLLSYQKRDFSCHFCFFVCSSVTTIPRDHSKPMKTCESDVIELLSNQIVAYDVFLGKPSIRNLLHWEWIAPNESQVGQFPNLETNSFNYFCLKLVEGRDGRYSDFRQLQ